MKFFLLTMFVYLLCIKNAEAQNPTYADIPGPENVLVVYNSRSQTSIAIKEYYKNARNIPSSNIVKLLDLDTLANITDPESGYILLIELLKTLK